MIPTDEDSPARGKKKCVFYVNLIKITVGQQTITRTITRYLFV